MKTERFLCPSCGGSHFGTDFPDLPPGPFVRGTVLNFETCVRRCHDEFETGCHWKGPSSECMVPWAIKAAPVDFGEAGDAKDF